MLKLTNKNSGRIQNGNQDTDTDCGIFLNQGPCWDAGDMLVWGKAQGRAETSALWNLSLWKASSLHNSLEEQVGNHPHAITVCHHIGPLPHRLLTVDMPGLHPTGPSGLPPTEQPYHCPTAQQDTTHPPVHRHTRPPLHQATACWPTVPPPTHWTTGTLAATHHRRAPTPPDAFTKPA
jgi:hypothetical protein